MGKFNNSLSDAAKSLLNEQVLEQRKLNVQLEASVLSLFYMQGARVNDCNKVTESEKADELLMKLKSQLTDTNEITKQLTESANEIQTSVEASVNCVAIMASNIQRAANAILKLAADVGSIYNIVNASDSGSDILNQIDTINSLIKKTAFNAQISSQRSMETSVLAAQMVPEVVVTHVEKIHLEAVKMLGDANKNESLLSEKVANNKSNLLKALSEEKTLGGRLQHTFVNCKGHLNTYDNINKTVNFGLNVITEGKSGNMFTIAFNNVESFFYNTTKAPFNGVKDYVLFFVKDKDKSAFSIAKAQELLHATGEGKKRFTIIEMDGKNKPVSTDGKIKKVIEFDEVLDTDGETLIRGNDYVVFLMIEFTDDYKKMRNDYSDVLSAPSLAFSMKYKLNSPEARSIKVMLKQPGSTIDGVLTFEVNQISTAFTPEYRCYFLPYALDKQNRFLTESEMATFIHDLEEQNNKSISEIKKEKALSMSLLNGLDGLYELSPIPIFNSVVANKVPVSNYSVAQYKNAAPSTFITATVKIQANTTDSFGHPLIKGQTYLPVILTTSDGTDKTAKQYAISLSDPLQTKPFVIK
ncbi:hypothetical protein [Psychroserpens algicola]|uniref:hypothetical protein n=1 Tax=Psychroserpens algicola TaxID=1719034 RepID=UPI001953581A|nr:hypothetical protein [Psychroserpens algicola]